MDGSVLGMQKSVWMRVGSGGLVCVWVDGPVFSWIGVGRWTAVCSLGLLYVWVGCSVFRWSDVCGDGMQ